MSKYPEMISLGLNCEVRAMIENWHQELAQNDPEFSEASLLHPGSNFFDWNISHPWDVAKCIDTGFLDVFKKENLFAREETDGTLNYVDDIFSGIRFHHTFSRVNHRTDQATIEQEYREKSEKILYLVQKFENLLESPTLLFFIRRGNETGSELCAIVSALKKKRANRPFFVINVRWEALNDVPIEIAFCFRQFVMITSYGDFKSWYPIFNYIDNINYVYDMNQMQTNKNIVPKFV